MTGPDAPAVIREGRDSLPIRIALIGRFEVMVGMDVPVCAFPRRRPAELLQLLALSESRSLPREVVMEQLWPQLEPRPAAANLRKAAHHARRLLGDERAVVLQSGSVQLFPGRVIETDLGDFLARSAQCLRAADGATAAAVLDEFGGELLPEASYAEWARPARDVFEGRRQGLLVLAGRWEELLAADPTDERAYRGLMRAALDQGRRHTAIRWYGRARTTLRTELGALPSADTEALYRECVSGLVQGDPQLVGRDLEMARAADVLAAAGRGDVATLLVSGPAGIGKTAVCRQGAKLARESGWIVASAAAVEDAIPYTPIAALVEQLLGRERVALDRLAPATRSVLAELTELAGPADPHEGPVTRHELIGALRALTAVTVDITGAGVMLVLDDAHAADEASVEVLRHLVAAAGSPVLVVLAFRPESAGDALRDAAAALTRAGRAIELRLGPVTAAETELIIRAASPDVPPDEVLTRAVALAEGNPFFARELAASLESPGRELSLSPTLAGTIGARFARFDEQQMDALIRLAVAGPELEFATVTTVSGLAEGEAAVLLDAALADQVLMIAGAGYRFRHELVRQALLEPLPPHRLAALHRETADRLANTDAPAAAVAHHWLDGERPREAVPWLLAAGRQAAGLGAFADALARLEPLLEIEPEHTEALILRAELLDFLGDAGAPEAYALAARTAGDPEASELRPREAFARLKSGDPGGALDVLDRAEPRTPMGRICEALTVSAAAAIGYLDDLDLASAKAEDAYRLAVDLGESWAVLEASWAYALAAHARGELPERLREYVRTAQRMPELATRLFDGQLCVTERLLYGGMPYAEVIDFADSLAAEAERLGARRGSAFALTLRGEAKLLSGELEGADADLARGVELHDETAAAAGAAVALQSRALVELRRDEPDEARKLSLAALGRARESNVGFHTFDRIYGALVASAEPGDEAVAEVAEAEAAIRGKAETCPTCRISFLVPAAVATARSGDLERARGYAAQTEQLIGFASLPPAWGASLSEIRGHLAEAEGGTGAHSHFTRAAEIFAAAGQPDDERRCAALAAATAD
jgi:DNA-binding SARP family transcriptional activator/tetratricopeptide (TPR) repeat protein